ncbi:hypothetical protein [Pseudomonas rhizosphaerae]|uniref:hypothetical protein n=1 Tax=Pseudomonas rhizosphaerae TaxID=216142 RepID=UPI002B46812F|nr:hypothetical protein [Pseudomonas rhizosphaerae]MEB2870252.1 hypothetical protein [Pseudomonas rhizosphaerae]
MSHGFEGEGKNQVLAEALGISEEDAEQYVTIDTNESDDGLIYGYIAIFDDSTPQAVLDAAGVGRDRSVDLGPNVFDEEE